MTVATMATCASSKKRQTSNKEMVTRMRLIRRYRRMRATESLRLAMEDDRSGKVVGMSPDLVFGTRGAM
jgi:hypothetical protein